MAAEKSRVETTPARLTDAQPSAFFHLALSSESRAEAPRHRLEQAAERPVAGAGQGEGGQGAGTATGLGGRQRGRSTEGDKVQG